MIRTILREVPVGALRRGACDECDAAAHLHVHPLDVRGQHVLVVQQDAAPERTQSSRFLTNCPD